MLGENGRNPVKNLPRPSFVHHETHMEGPRRELGTPAVGGERLTACATRPPLVVSKALFLNLNFNFLNRNSLLLLSNSYPIVLSSLGGPRSRPYTFRKKSRV